MAVITCGCDIFGAKKTGSAQSRRGRRQTEEEHLTHAVRGGFVVRMYLKKKESPT